MSNIPPWPETESTVWRPFHPMINLGASFIAIVGCLLGLQLFPVAQPPLLPPGAWLTSSLLVLAGNIMFAWLLVTRLWPVRVRHAAASVLPDVPSDPVTLDGSVVHRRLTHEL